MISLTIPESISSSRASGVGADSLGLSVHKHAWHALGTICEIQFVSDDAGRADEFRFAAVDWVTKFEAKYSRFRADSMLSEINAAAGSHWVEVDPEMDRMLDVCGMLHALSAGLLDATALPLLKLWDFRADTPRIPPATEISAARELVGWTKVQRRLGAVFLPREGMCLDFGGWGKEYAVDAVAEIAQAHRIGAALIDFGHDIRALGMPPGRPAWHIGLEDPAHPGTHRGSIALRNRSVASSGDYIRSFTIAGRRYGHIVDPRTGYPVFNSCIQATVIASSCLQAGVLSTTAFVLGANEGLRLIQETYGAEGLILTERARYQTRGFFKHVVES
ncbi:MAG TPA: FAD:protein FMN transferase [Opitutaceae bacterium]|nr:FAD:protein FMN transferase [Opitutaceae bacterium]